MLKKLLFLIYRIINFFFSKNSILTNCFNLEYLQVLLENTSVDLGELQAGILVRKGVVKLSGSRIIASNQSVVKLGVVVLPGGKLIADNTTFVGLGTAIAIHVAGEVVLTNCKFEECIEGIQVIIYTNPLSLLLKI